eukprot:1201009-Pyramimonas_sp.AAC.1
MTRRHASLINLSLLKHGVLPGVSLGGSVSDHLEPSWSGLGAFRGHVGCHVGPSSAIQKAAR